MPFNHILRYLTVVCGIVFGIILNLYAETIVVDRIYLIVNSQMLTRSEAQDVRLAIVSQKSSGEKTQAELNNQLLINLLQEMLLLDRANALKIVPMENEIDSSMNNLAEKQPQLLDLYSEADLKEQLKAARQAAQKLINDAEQDSDKLYREALALATSEANVLREEARKEINSQRESALNKLKSDADKLGDLIVQRLLAAK